MKDLAGGAVQERVGLGKSAVGVKGSEDKEHQNRPTPRAQLGIGDGGEESKNNATD